MKDNLQNPLKVLKIQSREAWSGCLEIEEPQDNSVGWNVYLLEGKIQYINSTVGQQERLNYLWQRYKLGSKCPQLVTSEASEYLQVCDSLADKKLSDVDIKKLLFLFIREGLTDVLSINKCKISLQPAKRIKQPAIAFSLEKLGAKLEERVKSWIEIKTYLTSSFCRLYLEQKNALEFYKVWKPIYASPDFETIAQTRKLSSFVSLFVAKSSLYQIATKLDVDKCFLAQQLKRSIEDGLLDLHSYRELSAEELEQKNQIRAQNERTSANNNQAPPAKDTSSDDTSTLVVCVDDSRTVQKQVKMTLEASGYQVLGILEPKTALKTLAYQQPAVIFLDINMPELNGYDLCSLLRKSQKFKDVPIVMLTGRDGMIDRVRAKLVGATDYLTKPCDPNQLIALTKALEKATLTS